MSDAQQTSAVDPGVLAGSLEEQRDAFMAVAERDAELASVVRLSDEVRLSMPTYVNDPVSYRYALGGNSEARL